MENVYVPWLISQVISMMSTSLQFSSQLSKASMSWLQLTTVGAVFKKEIEQPYRDREQTD